MPTVLSRLTESTLEVAIALSKPDPKDEIRNRSLRTDLIDARQDRSDLRSSHRPDLLAARLDHAVDDRGQAAAGVPVPGDALLLQIALTQDEVRLHRALALHLDQPALLRLVTPRLQELRDTRRDVTTLKMCLHFV